MNRWLLFKGILQLPRFVLFCVLNPEWYSRQNTAFYFTQNKIWSFRACKALPDLQLNHLLDSSPTTLPLFTILLQPDLPVFLKRAKHIPASVPCASSLPRTLIPLDSAQCPLTSQRGSLHHLIQNSISLILLYLSSYLSSLIISWHVT